MELRIEKRGGASPAAVMGASGISFLLACIVIGFVFLAYGVNPFKAYGEIIRGTIGSVYGITVVVWQSIPLLLCGVGLLLAFRASFWNIGAEGQLLMGAVAATWVALFSGIPGFLAIPVIFFIAFIAGALWGFVPAALKSRFQIPEVITSLMMNYIAYFIVLYLIHGPWKGKKKFGFAYTDTFPKEAWLPVISGTRIHWPTIVIAIVLVLVVYIILSRTKLGYEVSVISHSRKAGRYAGISYFRTVFLVMLVSGGAAGLAGAGEVAGVHHMLRHPDHISLGYGYTAIIVAWLARDNPFAVIVTSLLIGIIMASGDVVQLSFGMPISIVSVFTGLILFFLILSENLMGYMIVLKRREVTK